MVTVARAGSGRSWRTGAKRVAKAILPRRALHLLHKFRNGSGPLWSLVSSRRVAARLQAGVLRSRATRPFDDIDRASVSDTVLTVLLDPWRGWEQRETIATFKGSAFIEPTGGWIVASPAHLVATCLIDPTTAPRPSLWRYLEARTSARRQVRHEPRLLHLRDWGETNYWHFLTDLLGGRLRLAHAMGVDVDIPLLLGRRAFEQPFVQEILRTTAIGRRRLLIQGEEVIHSREVIHFETPRLSIESADFVLDCLGAPGGAPSGNKRVFLGRGPSSRRALGNLREVEDVCRRWRFEVIDTATMSVAEQVALFSQVRYLLAIHGAGLTNIIFRRGAPLSLLELFPTTTYLGRSGQVYPPPPHYFWLSRACGFRYDAIFGESSAPGDFEAAFQIDPATLEMKIKEMLE